MMIKKFKNNFYIGYSLKLRVQICAAQPKYYPDQSDHRTAHYELRSAACVSDSRLCLGGQTSPQTIAFLVLSTLAKYEL